MKNKVRTRVVSAVMCICLLIGLLPTTASAIDITGLEDFDPASQEAQISFKLERKQYVNIEVYINGELFGYIAKGLLMNGYNAKYDNSLFVTKEGTERALYPEEEVPQVSMSSDLTNNFLADAASGQSLMSEEPVVQEKDTQTPVIPNEEAQLVRPASVPDNSDAIVPLSEDEDANMVSDMKIKIVDKPAYGMMLMDDDGGTEIDNSDAGSIVETEKGNFTVHWTGRVAYMANRAKETYAVMNKTSTSDQVNVTLRIQPLGYPQKNVDCQDIDNGDGTTTHVHGEDWTWTQSLAMEGDIQVDYRLNYLLAIANGLYYDDGMLEELLGWLGVRDISDIRALNPNGIDYSQDPVKLATGGYNFSYTDMRLEGNYPLSFVRMYNSVTQGGSLGQGFTHGYDYKLVDDRAIINVTVPYGEELHFVRYQPGFGTGYYSMQNNGFTLEDDGSGGWAMTYRKGTVFNFDANGLLTTVTSPQNVQLAALTYSGDELTAISGVAGSYTMDWDDGHIVKVTDSTGRETVYGYDGMNLTSVTNPDGSSLSYSYDDRGYLSEAVDFNGDTTVQNTFDEQGRVTNQTFINANVPTTASFSYDGTEGDLSIHTYTNASGYTMSYFYDKYNQLVKTMDGDGNVTLSDYSNYIADQLTDAQSNSTKYGFDNRGNVTKATYPDGAVVNYTYTADNQISSIGYEDGTEYYGYDGDGFLTSFTDKRGNTTTYTFAGGVQTSMTDVAGNTTHYSYDGADHLTSMSYPDGGETTYAYDAVGRVTSATVKINASESATTGYEYTDGGKLTKTTDALGNETTYEYNANGFTTKTTDAGGGETSTVYGTNGQPLSITDANGNTSLYSYNAKGLLDSITDAMGNTTRYTYNDKALLTSTTDAEGNSTSYEYDSLDRRVRTTDALGGTTEYTYDSMGRTMGVTDANGNVTEYFYDKLGRTVKVTDAMSGSTTYSYDPNSNLLETKDANGISTYSSYDALNRVSTETDGEGNVTSYGYDPMGRVLSVTDALGNVTSYTYDLAGNALSQTDAEGNTTAFRYDKLGQKIQQINADNTTQYYTYDPIGNLLTAKDELGNVTAYTYDRIGDLLTTTDPLGHVTTNTYNANNMIASVTYADGGKVEYTYNSLGLTDSVTNERGFTTRTTYDALGRTAGVTDATGVVTSYSYDAVGNALTTSVGGTVIQTNEYDALNRLSSTKDGLGNADSYSYDKMGNLLVYTDREGNDTRYRYNNNYAVTAKTDAEGGITNYSYDSVGNTSSVTDAQSNVTSYTYNKNGQVLTATDALSGVTSNTYNNRGQLASTTDTLMATTAYDYDAAGNLLTETDSTAHVSKYEYDLGGNLTKFTNRENEWTLYQYDSRNRLIKTSNQLNHATQSEYDLCGNQTASIDGNGNRTEYVFDGLNRKISETNGNGSKVEYSYDDFGNTAGVTTDGGNGSRATTSYSYDLANNLLTETNAAGVSTSYVYDNEGNTTSKTDCNGRITNFVYDKLYRLTERTDDDETVTFAYDKVGNKLSAASDKTGTVTFVYDALYRTTSVTNEDGTATAYTWDAAGNRLSITYPNGNVVTTAYNILGDVSSLTDYDGTGITYTRDAEGRTIKETHSGGSTTEYDYNSAGLMTQQKEVTSDNTTRREIIYGYDDAGNLKSEQRSGVDIEKRDENVRYYYDKADQLVKTTIEGVTKNYTYDLAGNLLSDGDYTYTYDLQNRLLSKTGSDGTTAYTYDAAGNLVKEVSPDGTTEYAYTAQNKLKSGTQDNGQSSTYTYNALGARITNVQVRENQNKGYQNAPLYNGSTHIKDYTPALSDNRATGQRVWETEVGTVVQNDFETVTKHYTVDYLSVANRDIMVTEDGSFVQRYVYDENGTRISAEFGYADGTARGMTNADGDYGENPASDIAVNNIGKVWYRTSLLNSTLFAVDETGEVIAHMIYDPWGNPLTETYTDTNYSGLDNLNNYTGYSWDEVLNQYFAQNRFYDAADHRFTQEDSVKDGANWYAYCGNSPTINVDWLGLEAGDLYINNKQITHRKTIYGQGKGREYGSLRDLVDAFSSITLSCQYGLDGRTQYVVRMGNQNAKYCMFDVSYPCITLETAYAYIYKRRSGKEVNLYYAGTIKYTMVFDKDNPGYYKIIVDIQSFLDLMKSAGIYTNVRYDLGSEGGTWNGWANVITYQSITLIPSSLIQQVKDRYARDSLSPMTVIQALAEEGIGGAIGEIIAGLINNAYYKNYFQKSGCFFFEFRNNTVYLANPDSHTGSPAYDNYIFRHDDTYLEITSVNTLGTFYKGQYS